MKDNSKEVKKGDTFISLSNNKNYIEEAIKNGASSVIVSEGLYGVDTLIVEDTHKYLEDYLDNLYKEKFKKIKIIGITGTNGKTTSAYLLWQLLNKLNHKTGYIGTIGFYMEDKVCDLTNTTPDVLKIYEMINKLIDSEYEYVVMEVSSQALSYHRIGKLEFDYAVFTNLTREHLDYHKDMYHYALAKQELFKHVKNYAIVNIDDKYSNYFMLDNKNITYGINDSDYKLSDIEGDFDKTMFKVNNKLYTTNLIGEYNIYNLMISIIVLDLEHIDYDLDIFNNLVYPPGRMQVINYHKNKIIIDYAHTPDGIKNIITCVKKMNPNKVITIIGAGGDRDKTKRPVMGLVTTELSDYAIFTDDNPRTENEISIINDIVHNLDKSNYEIITNRQKAIIRGIQMLGEFDILLVLGKGHEDYQIVGNKRIHFSDLEVVLANIEE